MFKFSVSFLSLLFFQVNTSFFVLLHVGEMVSEYHVGQMVCGYRVGILLLFSVVEYEYV